MTLLEYGISKIEVNDKGSYTMLEVTCPRKGCAGVFWVRISWAYLAEVLGAENMKTTIYGRPCPYCCKAARIPEEWARKRPTIKIKKRSR